MNNKEIQRLLHCDCKNFSGGITSLAYAINKSPNILSNKLNVDCDTNHLNFQEAVELIEITGSVRTLRAIAAKINHILVPTPNCRSDSADILQRFLDITTASGNIGERIKSAVSPKSDLGRDLSAKEKAEIEQAVAQLIENAICLQLELRS